jgi:YD repeat-containing protein
LSSPFFYIVLLAHKPFIMPMKKKTSVYRTNLVTIGIGQGQIETLPYLFNETEYNTKGAIISQSSFTSDGLLVEKMAFEYNEQGRIITQYYFTEPDEPSEVVEYILNDKGLLIKDVKKYLDGSFDTTTYLYDDQERLTEKTTVDDEGVTDLREKFFWKNKSLVKHEAIDAEGNIVSTEEFTYDDKGNAIEHTQMDEESGENQRTVSTFDEANHKTGDELYDEEGDLMNPANWFHLSTSLRKSGVLPNIFMTIAETTSVIWKPMRKGTSCCLWNTRTMN